MASTDQTVRVFISSTFRDMHAERDHLVTVVFPELRERVERLGLEFFDVDLRWGVPAKDANGETANSWEYCRQWIDRVEPFFVCILGQRYGWEPEPEQLKDLDDRQRQQEKRRSITDMEVRHGVLETNLSRRSYFYLRADEAPTIAGEFVDSPLLLDKLELLKEEICSCGRPVRSYPCRWTGEGFAGMEKFGRLVLDDLWSGILRDQRYVSKDIWRRALGADPDTDPRYTDESQPVPRELWETIVELAKPAPKDPLDAEREQMDAFAASRLRWFQGRTHELQQLTDFLNDPGPDAPRLAVVAAVPGQGKSALLAKLHKQLKTSPHFVITHFVGATERSASAHALVQRLLDELDRSGIAWPAAQQEGQEPKRDFNSLCLRLAQRLGEYAGERRIVILLDALNQLSDGHDLHWLPLRLGPNVRVIVSCVKDATAKADSPEDRVLQALSSRQPAPLHVTLGPLTEDDVRIIVIAYLDEYCKVLDTAQVNAIRALPQARNPLYLLVMLNELRTLGGNDMNRIVGELIASMPQDHPDTVSLFRWVLQRLEVFSKEAVQWWCLYLAHGRIGMSSHELADLLTRKLGPDVAATALLIERGLRRYLQRRGPQLDFFHGQLREAVYRQYGAQVEAMTVHLDIAAYFREIVIELDGEFPKWRWEQKRSLSELPHHQLSAGMWDALEKTLTDIGFVEAKSRTGMVYDLISDYTTAEQAWPGQEEGTQREEEWQQRMREYADALIAYSRAHTERRTHSGARRLWSSPSIPPLPEPPPSVARTSEPEVAEMIREWTPIERVRAWQHFVSNHTAALASGQEFAFQVAYNSAASGPVAETLQKCLARSQGPSAPWIALVNRPLFSAHPACLKTLTDSAPVVALVTTPDARTAVTGSARALRVWNLETGENRILKGHVNAVTAIDMTPDARRAVSGSKDGTLRVWNLDTGDSQVLTGHSAKVNCVSMTPDGRYAVSGSDDKTARLWNLDTGESRIIKQQQNEMRAVAVTPDGLHAVSGGGRATVEHMSVIDVETGQNRDIGEPTWSNTISLTPDGRYAVSADWNRSLRIYDIASGECRELREPCGASVLRTTQDGRHAISAGGGLADHEMLRVWDLETGESRVLTGHAGAIRAISVTPDGRRAVTGSEDRTLRVWDLELAESSVVPKHDSAVTSVAVTPDGRSAVSTGNFPDNNLRIWNTETGESRVFKGHTNSIAAVHVTPDGRRAVSTGGDCTVRMWDLQSGESRVFKGHTLSVVALRVTPDGRHAISASVDKTLRIWDLATGKSAILKTAYRISDLCLTPDGGCVVSVGYGLRTLDLASGQVRRLGAGQGELISVTPDGRTALSWSCVPLGFCSWDLTTGRNALLTKSTPEIVDVCFAPDGRSALGVQSAPTNGALRLWNVRTGEDIAIYYSEVGDYHSIAMHYPMLVVGMSTGQVQFLRLIGKRDGATLPLTGPRITTLVRLWLNDLGVGGGHWDEAITATCDACGQRFSAPISILQTIRTIARRTRLGPIEMVRALIRRARRLPAYSPCLKLPAAAWNEPSLISECPLCHEQLKFNPFIVDNKDYFPAP